MRGAKGLQTSLEKLQRAADDLRHKPGQPAPSAKNRLFARHYQEPHLHELARFVSYGGKRPDQVKDFMAGHRQRHGDKAMRAMHELTATDSESGLAVLRPALPDRRRCRSGKGAVASHCAGRPSRTTADP